MGKNVLQNLNRNCQIHITYSVNCRYILWLMICLTSARGRRLSVSIAINRPIVIASCAYCLFLISFFSASVFVYFIFLYVCIFSFDASILVNKDAYINHKLGQYDLVGRFHRLSCLCSRAVSCASLLMGSLLQQLLYVLAWQWRRYYERASFAELVARW